MTLTPGRATKSTLLRHIASRRAKVSWNSPTDAFIYHRRAAVFLAGKSVSSLHALICGSRVRASSLSSVYSSCWLATRIACIENSNRMPVAQYHQNLYPDMQTWSRRGDYALSGITAAAIR